MRRLEASLRKASVLRLRLSKFLVSWRPRSSRALPSAATGLISGDSQCERGSRVSGLRSPCEHGRFQVFMAVAGAATGPATFRLRV